MKLQIAIAATLSLAASFVINPAIAQVDVEDLTINANTSNAVSIATNPAPANGVTQASGINPAELYYQLQVLQQEVLQLRGLVEEQAFQLKRVKQQRMDDYLDLDRRLSQLSKGSVVAASNGVAGTSAVPASTGISNASPASELKSYKAAINLVLKEQKYDDAIVSLNQHLSDYPRGRYSANAQYWLGEIYLVKRDLEQSRQWFSRLLGEFPDHSKVPDAKFKLGKVYDMLGDKSTAKNLLEEAAASNSNAARLAKEYLSAHFAT